MCALFEQFWVFWGHFWYLWIFLPISVVLLKERGLAAQYLERSMHPTQMVRTTHVSELKMPKLTMLRWDLGKSTTNTHTHTQWRKPMRGGVAVVLVDCDDCTLRDEHQLTWAFESALRWGAISAALSPAT